MQLTELPWGLSLEYAREEQIGLCIARRGVFDLAVSEVLYRLTDPGELALDVGANVGHMTSLLAARTGRAGCVWAFEPHPHIRSHLEHNVSRWPRHRVAPVVVHAEALSNRSGHASLFLNHGFSWNQGSASLVRDPQNAEGLAEVEVTTRRLDDLLETHTVGVMKVDVEGHERAVLQGACRALSNHRIRDVVFEDFDNPPTPVAMLLQAYGYTVFSIDHTLLGPVLRSARVRAAQSSGDDPSYLATTDPTRALARLTPRRWAALGRRHSVIGALDES